MTGHSSGMRYVLKFVNADYQNQGLTFETELHSSLQGYIYKYVQYNIIWNS